MQNQWPKINRDMPDPCLSRPGLIGDKCRGGGSTHQDQRVEDEAVIGYYYLYCSVGLMPSSLLLYKRQCSCAPPSSCVCQSFI